jgi:iron(III) transport system substrate-binding protein
MRKISRRSFLAGAAVCALGASLTACGASAGSAVSAAASSAAAASGASSAAGDSEMTLEELVAAAQSEATAAGAGNFMVYAPTSRIEQALAAFTDKYGIKGEYYNESGQDLYTKLTTELETGSKDTADVVLMQDSYLFQTQLVNYDYLVNYVPPYLKDKIDAEDQQPLVYYYYDKLFIYNNTDGSTGIDNVWRLTEASYKGKLFMKDLSKESVNKNFLAMLTGDEWAATLGEAYKACYGKEIALDSDCPNAGYQFIKMLLPNVTFGSGDGDIATELGNGNGGNMGLFVYSKLRDDSVNRDNLSICAYADVPPVGFSGFLYPMYLQMVKSTDRPMTAKLFIYFLLTEEGFKSAFQAKDTDIGTYATNSDIGVLEGDKELSFWKECLVKEDPAYLQQAYANGVLDFITLCSTNA